VLLRKQPNMLDFPPRVAERLKDRSTPIWLTEGVKKTDTGFCAGLAIVGLTGVLELAERRRSAARLS